MRRTLKQQARRAVPPREFVLNHLVRRIPLVDWRMGAYRRMGVRLLEPASTTIMLGTEVWNPEELTIGARSAIGRQVLLDARGGITIGADVNVSSYVRIMTAKHDVRDPDFPAVYAPVRLDDRVWVAMGATLLGGVHVGEGAVVAASAVVTRDVAPFSIVGGTPARPIGERSREQRYALGWRPDWL